MSADTADVPARLNAALQDRYRIERELGEGGMATVYLADDLKHERKVALKVLKPELAAVVGAERFLAEIKTTANLQHPHILPLFDSGEADGFLFFVMPYIEGETLREKIDREKQLPVDEAVGIATAVASALSVAHEQGVIHRDIKPGNILLSRGEPLVTDFGIAIAVTKSSGTRLTETGLSVGTPYYMSPEQATGDREITAASDVYALGCVLYEMLVGEPPYMGATAQAVLGKILTEKPRRPTAVRAVVPANVEGAILQALEKLPADRFRSASGFVRAMTDSSFRYGADSATGAGAASGPGLWKRATFALGGLSVILVGATLWSLVADRSARPTPVVLGLETPEGLDVEDVAISRDGSMFAISTRDAARATRLWIRRADEADFRPVPGTEGGRYVDFSPDGEWLVFRHEARNALVKVALNGSGALPILEVDSIRPRQPQWGDDGTIVFTGPDGVWRVPDTGEGGARLLSRRLTGYTRGLPDGSGTLVEGAGGTYLIDVETDSARLVVPDGRRAQYLETGHLLYTAAGGGLAVVPFDLRRHEVTGPPTPVLDGIVTDFRGGYDVSRTGTLVYLQGENSAVEGQLQRRFLFFDRAGRADTVRMTPRSIRSARLSPDGRYIAYGTYVGGDQESEQIQILDLVTGSTPAVTSEGWSRFPVWSPDGTQLAIQGVRDGVSDPDAEGDVYVISVDGGEAARRLLTRPRPQAPLAWSGQDEIVFRDFAGGNWDLGIMPVGEGADSRPYLDADYQEGPLAISPDGTLAAYVSDETGTTEVFVRGFPDPVGKWNVSAGRGSWPRWSPDGDELYFWRSTNGPDSLFAVPVRRDPDFEPGAPTFLFAYDVLLPAFDVHPDGRFLVADLPFSSEAAGRESRWLVVLNWYTTLEERLGRGGR
jgi:hypothetical protein